MEVKNLEAAAVIDRDVQSPIEEPGIEQMALQMDHAAVYRIRGVASLSGHFIEPKGEAFRGAPGLEKLGQRRLGDGEAGAHELLGQAGSGPVKNEDAANVDGVAHEVQRVGLTDGEAALGGHPLLDDAIRIGIERGGIVQEPSALERTKAGVEVIKPAVHQAERNHLEVQPAREQRMRVELRARAVSSPEPAAIPVQQGIPGAFEWQVARQLANFETMFLEPCPKMSFLRLPFPVQKVAEDDRIADDDAGVGGEHHVGKTRLRRDEFNRGMRADRLHQFAPLSDSERRDCLVNVAFHPRIDDVIDREMVRRTHQETGCGFHAGR
jgi:hypothetical protein